MELVVVLGVVVILTGVFMPVLGHVKENARRVICASNQRQIGIAIYAWAADHNDNIPEANILQDVNDQKRIQDLMASHRGQRNELWDGLGRLWEQQYCDSPSCFYCPSHSGDHPLERYQEQWYARRPPALPDDPARGQIFMNYHYGGHIEWDSLGRTPVRRRLDRGYAMVLVTDGLRTLGDFNHFDGMNRLRGDGSVRWVHNGQQIRPQLPRDEADYVLAANGRDITSLWKQIEEGE